MLEAATEDVRGSRGPLPCLTHSVSTGLSPARAWPVLVQLSQMIYTDLHSSPLQSLKPLLFLIFLLTWPLKQEAPCPTLVHPSLQPVCRSLCSLQALPLLDGTEHITRISLSWLLALWAFPSKACPVHFPAVSVLNTSLWICAALHPTLHPKLCLLFSLPSWHWDISWGQWGEISQGLYDVCKPNFLFLSIDSVCS